MEKLEIMLAKYYGKILALGKRKTFSELLISYFPKLLNVQ